MKRPLLFRVWDSQRKKMFYLDDLLNMIAKLANAGAEMDVNLNRYVLQQFTGLADSNNLPIYEGDIIVDSYQSNEPYGYSPNEWRNEEQKFIVKYLAPAFVFPSYKNYCIEDFKRVRVGNILETPELIKGICDIH